MELIYFHWLAFDDENNDD